MTLKERKILIAKHKKDIPQLKEHANEVGSCSVNQELGWTEGYIDGLSHQKFKTHEEMKRKL